MGDMLTVDVSESVFINPKDVGEDGLQLYVVAPARLDNHKEGQCILDNRNTYADQERAHDIARASTRIDKRDYCVYRLETLSRFNYKGVDSVA